MANNLITLKSVNAVEDYTICSKIWLEASLLAHDFIDRKFWISNQQAMTDEYLPASKVTMAYLDDLPVGFSAVRENYLEALFVLPVHWKNGIGRKLMKQLFLEHDELKLSVYVKNQLAVSFYQYMGFTVVNTDKEPYTGEKELVMKWLKGCRS